MFQNSAKVFSNALTVMSSFPKEINRMVLSQSFFSRYANWSIGFKVDGL